ncbi:uncharacterized protein J4E84_006230 [Alternaria hordeiaustralica]|uniref:uncharacterized protein n=1 Tax=Alternaria hordeiaustralica TaxID=1187925 RepID=UPI0020C21897|nr:uncharacterized protein J4E84_006230 [Alternaria hordeiaustralica]KAI4685502.1 hypothetical protein J4E84_006230 [Alternaria hordeiaustralica]
MVYLTKQAPKLLRNIGGKRHAGEDDHEEPASKRQANDNTSSTNQQEEIDINAEPVSSDNESHPPPPQPVQPAKPTIPTSKNTEDTTLRRPQKKAARKRTGIIRAPTSGTYQSGQAHKATTIFDDSKENTPASSAGSANDGPISWGMEHTSQKTSKSSKGYGSKTRNIHAVPSAKKFGKAASKTTGQTYGVKNKSRIGLSQAGDESDASSIGLDDEELFALPKDCDRPQNNIEGLRRPKKKAKDTKAEGGDATLKILEGDELDKELGITPMSPKSLKKAEKAARTAQLLGQLSSWKENQEPPSSQPDSSAPQEALDDISSYIGKLPDVEEEGSRCTLCSEPVEQEEYWNFWKGKDKTVKNKSAFCHAHKKKSAQEEYTQKGYPDIDWKALPRRIRRSKATLLQILYNDRSSIHRDRYEPLALTGKAAAVPSRRTDLAEDVQEELESYALDEKAAYPGYYGPHGRRVITESVMDTLKVEMKNCKDRVVQASGIAAFVQAVMVPEAAILLIMDDCSVGREEADEIREKTYDMGLLLNEEIEDVLERQDDSDDENEYQYK